MHLLALGDISFRGRCEDKVSEAVFKNVSIFLKKADLVVANLESPLVSTDIIPITGKCTLRGSIDWAVALKKCGIDLVSLANNHMMDYGDKGLFSTIVALDQAGISYIGAGKNRQVACSPIFREVAGRKIAFLARSSVEVSSHCFAGIEQPGVAFLDENELVDSIRKCKIQADLVVVMLHWGMEHYDYPVFRQRQLAERLVSAGADILLGHHPHVLQGEERIGKALVSYSSGNFLFDEFCWSMASADGFEYTGILELTEKNRQGVMLDVCHNTEGEISTTPYFTQISDDAMVKLDNSPVRQQEYQKLCSRLGLPLYRQFWKLYSMKREWELRLSGHFSPSKIIRKFYKIRPRHFKELAVKLRRSAKVTSGKSTNPYEG